MNKQYIYDWRWNLRASPEDLWTYVADTHHLNLVTGMPKLQFSEVPQPDGSVKRFAHAPIYSWLALDWEENPFDWVKPVRHSVRRVFSSRLFPIKMLQNVFRLTPLPDGGTELQFELTLEANGLLGRLLIPGIARGVHASFEKAFLQIDGFLQKNQVRPFDTLIIPVAESRLKALIAELRQSSHDPMLVDRLESHLQWSAVEDLTRMRPYAYADMWGTERTQTLTLFLHAASIGLLDLSWDILCPECRGAKHKAGVLNDLPETVHCSSCNIDYTTHFDQSIEATFSVNPDIAAVYRTDYCIGGPHATPHVLIQQVLQPGEVRSAAFPIKTGYYRLRAPRLGGTDALRSPAAILAPLPGQPWLVVSPEYSEQALNITITDDDIIISTDGVQPGEINITMTNSTQRQQVFIIEDGTWSSQIATAADVTALQAFRDLFSSQALRPGYTIAIQNMVVLFSDLKDSTMMYQTIGDAAAFGTVIDHFDILRAAVADHRGAVVKTIGDSVMAVFRDPADGLQAALAMIQRITDYNQQVEGQPLRLKLGLHQGACIAVTLNDRLDYFGSTVNIAARLEGQSSGSNIITTDAIIDDPAVKNILAERELPIETFQTALKGFKGSHSLYRITPANEAVITADDGWVDVIG